MSTGTTRATKKPVPAPVRPQTTSTTPRPPPSTTPRPPPTKKPAPPPVKPQANPGVRKDPVKKPAPPPVKQQVKTTPPSYKPPTPAAKTPYKPNTQKLGQVSSGQAVTPPQKPAPEEPKADNWISRTVQGQVQKVGDYAGGFVNGIGERVNKFGEGVGDTITNQTRYWGQGVSGYGNQLKDAVGVGGQRVSTAGNPLGIAGSGEGKGSAPGAKAENSGVRTAGQGSAANPLGFNG